MAPPPLLLLLLLAAVVPAFSSRTTLDYLSEKTDPEFKFRAPKMTYHKGRVLSTPITVNIIWYGQWNSTQKCIIRDFIRSISSAAAVDPPSVSAWWAAARLYDDKTPANVTAAVLLGSETADPSYSRGKNLSRDSIASLIRSNVVGKRGAGPPPDGSAYLLLTSHNVTFPEFCQHSCGSHSYLDLTGRQRGGWWRRRVPYAWVGNSGEKCAGMCAFPFSVDGVAGAPNTTVVKPPNGDVGVDGMVIMVAHEMAEMATDPFGNGWFAVDPSARQGIANLCQGVYGPGSFGINPGKMPVNNKTGGSYNVVGYKGKEFVAPWLWNRYSQKCEGPYVDDKKI